MRIFDADVTGSLNVSGSSNLKGGLVVSGSQTVTGSLTVHGNAKLGDQLTDTHTLTGSLRVTGSLSGSLTGSLRTDYVDFNTGSTITGAVGRLTWNPDDLTLNLGMDPDVTQQIGQELYYPPVFNGDSIDLINGTLVMVDPLDVSHGDRLNIIRAVADGSVPSKLIVGVLTENVNQSEVGFATWFGLVRGLHTADLEAANLKDPSETWFEGTLLYASPTRPGGLTSNEPTSPNLKVTVAAVTRLYGNNVDIMVRPDLNKFLGELNDVNFTSVTDSNLIVRSGSQWVNSNTLSGSYVVSGSLDVVGTQTINGNQIISGSITITQNISVLGTSSFVYVTSSNLNLTGPFIYTNIFEPIERFGGLVVFDSGSESHLATASLLWDSLNDHWIYQNASGSNYSGGMLLSGPRNTGSLGDELGLTSTRIPKSVGGDHLDNSNIYDTGTTVKIISNTEITGSLKVTGGISGLIDYNFVTNVPSFITGYTETQTFQDVTDLGNVTSNDVTARSFIVMGGAGHQFLKADGTLDGSTYLTAHPSVVAASSSNNSGRTYIQDILLDQFGHITGITTASETVVNTDIYVTGATFNNTNGIITLTKNDGNTVTVDIDGRFLTSYTETQNLQDVTDLGSDTTNDITAKSFIVAGASGNQFLKGDGTLDGTTYLTSASLNGYATTGYVTNQISLLVDSAPGTLDTLNELAAALGDDPNFATTIATAIGNKVSKSGDTMTGNLVIQKNSPLLTLGQLNVSTGTTTIQMFAGGSGTFNSYSISYHKDTGVDQLEFIDGGGTARIFFENGGILNAAVFKKTGGLSTQFLKADGTVDSNTYLTAHPSVSAASSSNNSGRTYIQDILLDQFGHITGITTATETLVNTDNFTTGATFNTGDGVVTFTRNDGGTYTVDLDGRFLTAHPSVTAASSSNNSGRTYIQDILVDSFGHITGITTATETVVDTNDFITDVQLIGTDLRFVGSGGAFTGNIDLSTFLDDTNNFTTGATFNTSDGVVTFTRNNGNTYTVDLDGRYLTSFSETDTLATVTARGNTTTTSITVSGLTSNNDVNISGGTLTVYNNVSGSTVFAVDGTNGRLFAVTDDLSNSLFSVNTISGLPVIEAFADYHIVMGRFNQNDFYLGTTGEIGMGTLPVTGYKLAVNGNLRATSFVKTGGTSSQFLKADGSVDSSTYLTAHPSVSASASSNNSGRTYIQDILLDSFGHITGITTATETVVDTDTVTRVGTSGNEVTGTVTFAGGGVTTVTQVGSTVTISTSAAANTFLTGATFNTSDGVITLARNDGNTVTVDIDGRFLTAESDTLATVTARGASTSTAVSFNGGLTTTGLTNNSSAIIANSTSINPDTNALTVVAGGITQTGWGINSGIGGRATGVGTTWAIGHNNSNLYFGIGDGLNTNSLRTFLEVTPGRQLTLPSLATAGFVKTNASGVLSIDTNTYLTAHPAVTAASSVDNGGRTYIQDILLDQYGHITGITSATETVVNTDTNYYVTSASFNTGNGIITLSRNDGGTVTVDIDGRFSALGHTHDDRYLPYEATSDLVKNTGWYTIAVNNGNRASGKFLLRDTSSGNHQSVVFYATHFYGNYSDITVLINSYYGGSPFRSIRIVDGGTYDGALLQVQVDLDGAQVKAWLLEDIQNQGWIIKDWVDDGTDPGDVPNFAAMVELPVQVDLDNAAPGGIITTGNIYGGGDTTQYLYLNTNNYSTTLDGRYYTETEIGNFFGGTTAITGYNKSNWDTAFGWGNHGVQGYATTGYVQTQITNLIDGAPAALDTLNELAAALGDDANFATTISNSISAKLPLSGGTMTGNIAFGATSNLGLTWGLNTDAAFIKFVSTSNSAGGSYLEIGTQDDSDEEIKFTQSGNLRFYLATDGFLKNSGGYKYVFENGTWGINISGNAATVTNGVYTDGSYSNPSWITALAGSKITGNIGGSAYNITQYTINQNLGTGDTPTFSVVRASRFEATASGTRNKLALWGTDTNYTIGMQDGYTYGGLNNDYAMTFQMNNDSDRGFWWGDTSHNTAQGAMALTTDGNLTVARRIRVGYGESDTTTPNVPLQVYGSGSLVFDVQGSQGQLFSVTDNLSGSLFSVNDISGLPILEVNSDDSVIMGRYNQNDFVLDTNGNMGMGNVPVSGTKLKVTGNINSTKVSIGSANYSYDLYNNGTTYLNGTLTMDDFIALTDSGYFVGSSSYGFRFNNAANTLNNMTLTNADGHLYVRGNVYVGGNGSSTGDILASQAWVGAQGFITGFSNFFTTGATFNTGNGIITFTRNNGDTYTVDIDGKYAESSHTHSIISDITDEHRLFNNMGQNHSTYTDFDSVGNFGARFVQGTTNGPGTGSSQFYGFTLGLGDDYGFDNYALQLAIPRYNSSDRYITFRTREATTWGSWVKIYAGYADTAGALTSMNISQFTNNSGYLTAHPSVSAASSSDNSGRTYIQDILLDSFGHITGITTATETVVNTDTNYYVTSAAFNSANGNLTLTRNDGGTVTANLDGRYLTSYSETDTLATVTSRGASTTNDITIGGLTVGGSLSYGTYTSASNYVTGADNILLKGNSTGVSGIFFESEKDGTNINHPSDFAFIQYHAYGIGGSSGEANRLVIGVSNDADDIIVLNPVNTNGLVVRVGAGTTEYTVYHSGNIPTWNQNTTGNAATATLASTVTINYNNDSNSTYQMLWGSGNSVYGTAGVYLNPASDYVYATSFNASDWFRSSAATGWYNSTYGGGIYQTESTMVRTYDGRGLWIDGGNNNMVQDATLYVTATNNNDWLAHFNAYNSSKTEYGIYVNIAAGATYGYALRTEGGSFTYRVDGSGRVHAPIYYDINDTAYYLNPASTSNLATVKLNSTASGTEVFTVDGVNGRLFTITDDLSDSLFSVNTIAGVPVIEAFSDYRVIMGRYNQYDLHINTSGQVAMGTSTATANYKLTVSGSIVVTPTGAWNAATPALNVGGTGDGRLQVRHIYGKSSGSAATDHLWLQYQNTGNHVQIGDSGGGNHLYVSGNIYMGGYFGGNIVATQSWVGSQGYLTSHPSVSAASSSDNSGRTYIQDILLDSFGHITGITTATETVTNTDTNYYVTSASFNTGDGVITLTRNDGGTVTVDIDGRFQPLENQRVSTSDTVRFSNTYTSAWFRNDNNNTGLYNENTTMHWSSSDNGYWDVSSTNSVSSIRFYTGGHKSALRGYVYADTNNHIGFLNTGGNWGLRMDNSYNVQVYGDLTVGNSTNSNIYMTDSDETTRRIHCNSNRIGFLNSSNGWSAYSDNTGNWISPYGVYGTAFYDIDNSNYYLNPNGYSNLGTVRFNSSGAGAEVIVADGVNGRLFTITDDMTDSIFSVNTISGLPVIEAFADYTVVMGRYGQNDFKINGADGAVTIRGNTVWHAGNDGSGSGLDADLLDGQHGSYYASVSSLNSAVSNYLPLAGGTMTGTITITNTDIRSNAASDWTGDPGAQGKIQYHSNRWYIVADQSSNRIVQFRRNGSDVSYIANDGVFHGNVNGTASAITSQANSATIEATTTATANKIVLRDGSGNIYANYILGTYFNASSGNSENPTIGQIWTQNTSDDYLRKSTPAHFISQLGLATVSYVSGRLYKETFTNVTSVNVNHGLGTDNVIVQVYDENGEMFFPSSIRVVSTDTVTITFVANRSGKVVIYG